MLANTDTHRLFLKGKEKLNVILNLVKGVKIVTAWMSTPTKPNPVLYRKLKIK
jgi:hypothetical protein